MSLYAQFDEDGPCLQIASNTGWSEFGDWLEKLTGFQRVRKLFDEGNTEDIDGVRSELEEALDKSPPDNADVADVAHSVIHAIDAGGKADVLIISAGVKIEPDEKAATEKPQAKE